MFYPHAHDQTGDSEERLDDSSDESVYTVDFPSGENSASSGSVSEEESLASQKSLATAVKGNLRNEMLPRLRRTSQKERKKGRVSNFFTVYGLRNINMILFAGRSRS